MATLCGWWKTNFQLEWSFFFLVTKLSSCSWIGNLFFVVDKENKRAIVFAVFTKPPTPWAWEHAGSSMRPWTAGIFRIISDKAGGPLTNATRRQFNVRRSSPENSLISIYRGVRIKLTFTKTYDVKFQLLLSAASGAESGLGGFEWPCSIYQSLH